MRSFIKTISTFFFVGYLPLIPGTFGSLAGIALLYFIHGSGIYPIVTIIVIVLGFLVSAKAQEAFGRKDAPCIVIDEVGGMLLSFSFIPFGIRSSVAGFFLFRILDTFKPFPAKRLERLPKGVGVMADDIVAALYTNIILQIVFRLTAFKTS
ncbi:MAG: phosphatidylglycerophosphatase A [Candidatus Omnitrophota bacterium]